ncbi:MAG: amidohydrolase family protein [Pyrinomonadaceae bacterium]|nr:amidohydrolase family protein [Pyrinomonadaceae bacterium]
MKFKLLLLAVAAIGLCGSIALGQSYAITNARIVTVSGSTIDRGTVVIRDGLIYAVGPNLQPPADVRVFDGNGLTVYPGFFDSLTTLGLQAATPRQGGPGGGGPSAASQQQSAPANSNYPAGLRPEDMTEDEIRTGEAQFESARNAGFTTALTVGRTGIMNGRSAVINLAGDNVSAMLLRSPAALHVSFATIPGQYPASLLGMFSATRQMFLDAQRLKELKRMYAADPKGMRRPEADRSLEALIPVLDREMPIVINANSETEIIRAINIAKEFNLRLIVAGGQEAGKVADRLKAIDAAVLLSLNFPKRTTAASADADPEPLDVLRFRAEVPKTAAKLAQAGVRFAFQSGGMTSLNDFTSNAAKSVENGLSQAAAVRAMTLAPAEIFGIADRTGSIEAGKIANLTVVRGDVLGKEKAITHVFVDGKLFEIKAPPPSARPAANGGNVNVANVAGNYSINVEIPGNPVTGTLAFIQQGAILSGTMQTTLGTAQIKDGKVTADGFEFSASVNVGEATVDIIVRGKVAGNQISGTIDSNQGTIPFSGTRNP